MKKRDIILGCVLFLIVVQVAFSIPAPVKWLEAVWSAGDVISFAGTIALGVVAIKQAENANDMSKRLMQIEENRHKFEVLPFIVVTDCMMPVNRGQPTSILNQDTLIEVCQGTSSYKMSLELIMTNTTQAYLSFVYDGASYLDSTEKLNWDKKFCNPENKVIGLCPNESRKVILFGDSDIMLRTLVDKKIQFCFRLVNRFGDWYKECIDCSIITIQNTSSSSYHLATNFEDYHIGKCRLNKDGYVTIEWEDI